MAQDDTEDRRIALTNDHWCFVCGQDNPSGLRLVWHHDADGQARTVFHAAREHQGWRGVVHGGILAAVLDEAMHQRLRFTGIRAVTANLSVRYRRPAPTEAPLVVEGELIAERSRLLTCLARVKAEDGTLYAEAEGTCVRQNR